MTFAELRPRARALLARQGRRACPDCGAPLVARKAEALPWVFWCPIHGSRMQPLHGPLLADCFSGEVLARLDPFARIGAARLEAWARRAGEDEASDLPSLVELLDFLTTSYRRPSPPTLAEIPRVTPRDRMRHEALRRPIARQALALVVPEYDRAAPVFTKAAAPGLTALTRGSLLQTYALAVGLGRLIANPVVEAARALAASDFEGKARLDDIMRSWPAPLRRHRAGGPAGRRPTAFGANAGCGGPRTVSLLRRRARRFLGTLGEAARRRGGARLPRLGLEASLGVLMRSAQERRRVAGFDHKADASRPTLKTSANSSRKPRFCLINFDEFGLINALRRSHNRAPKTFETPPVSLFPTSRHSPRMNREAGPLMNRENPTPGSHFSGESTHETRTTLAVVCAS